ncbi:hypothetical protein [uncultured Aquimarina sp.]|uniref:hypothetical protein n=1 Tax=uncultured Aquimarina sp. TaxID=575652 RepID=UPI0026051461|nr:hypothetical protein [uncultured Aquimarina sp.]
MKQEQQLLYKVMRHFEGMQKMEVFDFLHRMEVLLHYAKNPLRLEHLKKVISSNIDQEADIHPFGFTILPNGNFCELEGANEWIHIYKENKRGWSRCIPFNTYYFKTKYAPLELVKLTKKHLQENVRNTKHEHEVGAFLSVYTITKKDHASGKMSLLEIV